MMKLGRISDLGSVVTGKTPSSNKPEHFGSDYPFINPTDMDEKRFIETARGISRDGYHRFNRQVLPPNSICFVCIGATIGKICMTRYYSLTNQQINSIVVDLENHDPYFVYYLLSTYADKIKSIAGGAATPIVNKSSFSEVEVPIFPLPTQRKIASILSAYDDLIENNLRRISILEEMARNLYREWFVKFRFPGHENVRFVDSELGRIPEGWEVGKFGDIYNTSSGGTPSRIKKEYYGNGYPWIKTRELNDRFIIDVEESITELGLKKSSAKLFPKNTVLMAIYGATIGKLGILSTSCATNQACVAMLPKEDGFEREYAYLFLKENRDKLIGLGQGAAQQNISQIVIKQFPVLKPPNDIVKKFSDRLEPLFDIIEKFQRKNCKFRQTLDLLLPKLISGEIDVTELKIEMQEEIKP